MNTTNWADLLQRAEILDRDLTEEELLLWKRGILDGNTRLWNVEYVHAVQRAVDGHNREQLDAMLMAEIPIPQFLLPFLASEPQGRRPPAFTAVEDKQIRRSFDRAVNFLGMSQVEAKQWLASLKRVNKKTIERSLKRTEKRD